MKYKTKEPLIAVALKTIESCMHEGLMASWPLPHRAYQLQSPQSPCIGFVAEKGRPRTWAVLPFSVTFCPQNRRPRNYALPFWDSKAGVFKTPINKHKVWRTAGSKTTNSIIMAQFVCVCVCVGVTMVPENFIQTVAWLHQRPLGRQAPPYCKDVYENSGNQSEVSWRMSKSRIGSFVLLLLLLDLCLPKRIT